MSWKTLDALLVEMRSELRVDRARARSSYSYPFLDLFVPIEDWPRCSCSVGSTTLQRRRADDGRPWWWCSVCNLPVRRAGME